MELITQEEALEVQQVVVDVPEVTNSDQYRFATDKLKQAKNMLKWLDERRKKITKPIDEAKSQVMAEYKKSVEPINDFISSLNKAMIDYQDAEQRRLNIEQERIEEEALAKAKAEGLSEIQVPVVNEVSNSVRGSIATSFIKDNWMFEVVDESLVPREYLSVDPVKVNKAIKSADGLRNIEGLNIYNERKVNSR